MDDSDTNSKKQMTDFSVLLDSVLFYKPKNESVSLMHTFLIIFAILEQFGIPEC